LHKSFIRRWLILKLVHKKSVKRLELLSFTSNIKCEPETPACQECKQEE
jgi:hypothetical protein